MIRKTPAFARPVVRVFVSVYGSDSLTVEHFCYDYSGILGVKPLIIKGVFKWKDYINTWPDAA